MATSVRRQSCRRCSTSWRSSRRVCAGRPFGGCGAWDVDPMRKLLFFLGLPITLFAGLVGWMLVRAHRGRTLPGPLQSAATFGLELVDELALGHGGVPTVEADEGAF